MVEIIPIRIRSLILSLDFGKRCEFGVPGLLPKLLLQVPSWQGRLPHRRLGAAGVFERDDTSA